MKTFQENRDYYLGIRRKFIVDVLEFYKNGGEQEAAVQGIENIVIENTDNIVNKIKNDMAGNKEILNNFEIEGGE